MNQGGNLRYFPPVRPWVGKVQTRLMTLKRVSSKKNERLLLVQSISGIVRITIWNPLGLAFQGKWLRLASVPDPSERDVNVRNSQV